jgi:hypothetical protein
MRTTSRKCPLNKKLESSEDESEGSEGESESSEGESESSDSSEGSESEEESSEEESDSSEGESEGEVRYDVHGPAPEGFAQLASDNDASSEWEAPEAPADTRKRSSRKRSLVDRFEAGAASSKARKARKAAKRPAKIEASKAPKKRKTKAAKRSPKRSAFHLPNLPSFADKYPALFAQTQNVTPSLQDDIYDATQEHVLCVLDVDNHVDHCLTVARNFINVVRDIRSDNGLEDVPDTDTIMDHVAVKSRAAYMSSHGCPDPAPIAEKMPAPDVDPSMSCKQVFQAAYDTTKTEAFFEAVRSVVPEAKALIYAVKRWHEDHVSAPVHEFLLGYARILYSRHVVDITLNL